jgi:uncharacterized protein involved in exopolysaccharide biosynthesis
MATSQETKVVAETPVESSRRRRWGRWLGAFVVIVAVGALAGAAASRLAGPDEAATVYVRAPLSDASCLYFTCPQPPPGPLGNAYVVGQANILRSQTIAQRVAESANTPSAANLLSSLRTSVVSGSNVIAITYTAGSRSTASRVARAFADKYVQWANQKAVLSLAKPLATVQENIQRLPTATQNSPRAQQLFQAQSQLEAAQAAYQDGEGPDAAQVYGGSPNVTRVHPTLIRAAGLGAAVGLVIAIAALLFLPSLVRRNRDGRERPSWLNGSE